MEESITYEHLLAKLRDLGFNESTFLYKSYPKRKFIHPDYPAALSVLPDEPNEPAHHMHISGVLAMIKVNRIADPNVEFFLN